MDIELYKYNNCSSTLGKFSQMILNNLDIGSNINFIDTNSSKSSYYIKYP